MDNFDILTEDTKHFLKQVAAPFNHLVAYYANVGAAFEPATAPKEQTKDVHARKLVYICGLQYACSDKRACDSTVERALQTVNRIMGPTCEETNNATLMDFYECEWYYRACAQWELMSVSPNRCFHNALMRYSNYSTRVYESFISSIGTYLLMELDVFGFCRHIAETETLIANFTERRQEVLELVQGVAKQLIRGKKALEKDGVGKSKTWTELARPVVHAGIEAVANGSDFPYPSQDGSLEKYQKVGDAIINSIHANNFNAETYRYVVIVYKPGSDPEEVCLMNHNSDVVQGNYRNVNYLVSRVEAQLTSSLSSRIVQDNATTRASFG
ncbi:hypothetical protein AAVH_12116 [Aphelenchoides avenae]|nr:hypothetical protein AAVH_12116 [Aphelenchus avenae]